MSTCPEERISPVLLKQEDVNHTLPSVHCFSCVSEEQHRSQIKYKLSQFSWHITAEASPLRYMAARQPSHKTKHHILQSSDR